MPKETDRLKLPLPLGNENVTRESINGIFEKIDAGVATEREVRDAYELASSKQNVIKLANNFAAPDTAITAYPEGYSIFYVGGGSGGQGGAWRTTVGATEAFGYVETVRVGTGGYQTFTEMYSGNDAANRANNKQYKRNKRDSNASWQPFERVLDVDDYNSLVTYSDNGFIKKSIIIPASANLNNYTAEGRFYCPANVTVVTLNNCPVLDAFYLDIGQHAGVVQTLTTFDPSNLQVFQRNYYNGTWGDWYKVPSRQEFEMVQKHRLTQSTGFCINVSNGNANNIVKNGDYVGENIASAPTTAAGAWWYIRVSALASDYVKQEAMNLFNNTYQTRTGSSSSGSLVWGEWSPDLFQSGVDAKNGVVGAINANGGSASTSDSWATLASKVQTVGPRYASGVTTSTASNQRILFNLERGGTYSTCYFTVSGLSFRPNRIIVKIPRYTQQPFLYSTTSRSGANGYNLFGSINNTQAQTDQYRVYEQTGQTTIVHAYVNDTGFLLPAMDMSLTQVEWEAFLV